MLLLCHYCSHKGWKGLFLLWPRLIWIKTVRMLGRGNFFFFFLPILIFLPLLPCTRLLKGNQMKSDLRGVMCTEQKGNWFTFLEGAFEMSFFFP